MSEPAIVLDHPVEQPAIVVTVPATVVIDNSSQVTISDDFIITIEE